MHVALCHNALVPPAKYGGTERVVFWLARALNRLGHKTTLLAKEGSAIEGTRCLVCHEDADWEDQVPSDVDVLHLWSTPQKQPRRPFIVTIEGNGQPGERFLPNTLFISSKHAQNHGATQFVYNGIDVESYRSSPKRDDYAVFLAKASWSVKNLEGAITVAKAAGVRLEVMGSRDWPLGLHRAMPALGGIHYRGMVDDDEKRDVLARARALIFPVRWHEPFGIALTEALASGCYVLGTPYGSLPEIVTKDVGVLSSDANELVKALRQPERFSPDLCRKRVLNGLSDMDMARSYLRFYERVIHTGHIVENVGDNPGFQTPLDAKGLNGASKLPWDGHLSQKTRQLKVR